jgi:hypothetical protein
MANEAMAMNAFHGVFRRLAAGNNVVDEIAVAPETVLLKDARVPRLDHDRFVKVLQRKTSGMTIPVVGLGNVLGEELVRQMTIDTLGRRMVGALDPRIVFVVHDVTVGTRTRVCREIAQTFTVLERKRPDTGGESRQNGNQKKRASYAKHSSVPIPARHKIDQASRRQSTLPKWAFDKRNFPLSPTVLGFREPVQ